MSRLTIVAHIHTNLDKIDLVKAELEKLFNDGRAPATPQLEVDLAAQDVEVGGLDHLISELGAIIAHQLRDTDLAARIDDHSFGVLLKRNSMPAVNEVAERLLNEVASHTFADKQEITCSIGICFSNRFFLCCTLVCCVFFVLRFSEDRHIGNSLITLHDQVAYHGIVEPEGRFDLITYALVAFDIHQNVMCFVNLVYRVS